MKKSVIAVFAGLMSAVAFAADVDDVLVSFTKPSDATYKDDTPVLSGECYAVVWSSDAKNSVALNSDGTAVGDDKVVMITPLDGITDVVFRLPGDYTVPGDTVKIKDLAGRGVWRVYLLDTRRYPEDEDGVIQTDAKPEVGFAKTGLVRGLNLASTTSGQIGSAVGVDGVSTTVDASIPEAAWNLRIKDIQLVDGFVHIKVLGSLRSLAYELKSGSEPDNLKSPSDGRAQYGTASGEMTIIAPKTSDAQFFQVNRK